MRKILFIILAIGSIYALPNGFGLYLGGNFTGANINIDQDYEEQWNEDFSSKFNLSIGLRISMGPLAVGGGFGSRSFAASDDIEIETSYRFLELWSVYPFRIGPISVWSGPSLAFPLGGTITEDGFPNDIFSHSWKTSRDCENIPLDTPYQCTSPNTDFGLLFGLSIPIGTSLAFSNGYYLGFMEILKPEAYYEVGSTNSDETTMKWSSIFATITYKL